MRYALWLLVFILILAAFYFAASESILASSVGLACGAAVVVLIAVVGCWIEDGEDSWGVEEFPTVPPPPPVIVIEDDGEVE